MSAVRDDDGEVIGYECPDCGTLKTTEEGSETHCQSSKPRVNDLESGFRPPKQILDRDIWVCWKYEDRGDDKPTKPPINPQTGEYSKSSDRSTWTSHEDAVAYADSHDEIEGVGVMMPKETVLAAIDIDDARDAETGETYQWAWDVIQKIDSYTEVSPSGTGYRIFLLGFKPSDSDTKTAVDEGGEVELYDGTDNRYLTFTGERVTSTSSEIEQRSDEFTEVYDQFFGDEEDESLEPADVDLSDSALIEKAKNAKNGDYFTDLWNGDWERHGHRWKDDSHSEADLALCTMLAFWTGGDSSKIEDLWSKSGLADRDKFSRDDYRRNTIAEAVRQQDEHYQPQREDDFNSLGARFRTNVIGPLYADSDDASSINLPTARQRTAQILDEHFSFIVPSDDVDDWRSTIYVYRDGIYLPIGQDVIEMTIESHLGSLSDNSFVSQVVEKIRRRNKIIHSELRSEPERLVVENGILDLTTGEMDEWTPNEYHKIKLPLKYDPDAECPAFDEFLHEVSPNYVDTLYQAIATSLYQEQVGKALMLLGDGGNGKTVFLRSVEDFLGTENVENASLQSLSDDYVAKDLMGKLANIQSDLSDQSPKGLGRFKELTGGDAVRGKVKYEDAVKFTNTATMMFSCNKLPQLPDDTRGNWRRWILVQFPNSFTGEDRERCRDLLDRLTSKEEQQGLLARCVEEISASTAGRSWFPKAPGWEETRRQMLRASDPVFNFAETCLRPSNGQTEKSTVRKAYNAYASENGFKKFDERAFSRELMEVAELEIDTGRDRSGGKDVRTFTGVELSPRGEQYLHDDVDDNVQLDQIESARRTFNRALDTGGMPKYVLEQHVSVRNFDQKLKELLQDGTLLKQDHNGEDWIYWT